MNTRAALQIKRLLPALSADQPRPLFVFDVVFDAGYDPIQLALDLGEAPVAVLVRLRRDRCFYADPDPALAAATGRPRRHGAKFACRDSATWPTPNDERHIDDVQYGHVRVRAWMNLQAIPQNHRTKGVRGTLILVEVSRLPGRPHEPQVLWLWWLGLGAPDLDLVWRA